MGAEDKLARQRLSVLELAETLGNVSEACRQRGMHRSQFYEYKKRFEQDGLEGLKDLPPIHKSHPFTTAPEVVEQILETSLKQPAWGCVRISNELKRQGISVSSPTVQKILIKNGMASRYERWLKLEAAMAEQKVDLDEAQMAMLEKLNPCHKDRHVESRRPGELLAQDTLYVGQLKGIGKIYLHAVVDTYSSYAFGFLYTNKTPAAATAVLHNDALPFYKERDITVSSILTDNGREFCGKEDHVYELFLALNDIEHRRTKVKHPWTNGFVERFNRTVQEEFFGKAFRTKFFESVESLQTDLDVWLVYYNNERTHQGYRNMGRRPIETIDLYLDSVKIDT